jgi:peptide/nickel transport system ATP-binding protein/oligopeptide transport system ATP-binding protein
MEPANTDNIMEVRNLRTHFLSDDGTVKAVEDVSWDLPRGKTLALVGESGCGKSVTALSIMRLVPSPPGRIVGGQIVFDGTDLLRLSERQMRRIRGGRIGMIFQEPMTSLNPVYTIGYQIEEVITAHQDLKGRAATDRAVEMLEKVGIPAPARRVNEYPHQMSGGMRQRVMIAMALACSPELIIADEPTTALDVTIQAQVLDLLRHLQKEMGMSILLITHDLGVVAEMADLVAVMYASKIAEAASVRTLYAEPKHPYTKGLFRSIPRLGGPVGRLDVIPGTVPSPLHFPEGCKFHPRCTEAFRPCPFFEPPLKEIAPGHQCACWKVFADLGWDIPRPATETIVDASLRRTRA